MGTDVVLPLLISNLASLSRPIIGVESRTNEEGLAWTHACLHCMLSFVKRTSLNLVLRHLTSLLANEWNRFILKKEKQKLISCSRRRWRNDKLQWTVCGSLETNYQLSNMEWKRARWDWRRTCWVTTWHYKDNQIICRGYYMAERRYKISHQVSKIISHVDWVQLVKYFPSQE